MMNVGCYRHVFGVQNTSLLHTRETWELLWHCCFSSLCDMHCSCHLSPGCVPHITQAYLSSAVLEREHNCMPQLAVMCQNCVHCTVSISSQGELVYRQPVHFHNCLLYLLTGKLDQTTGLRDCDIWHSCSDTLSHLKNIWCFILWWKHY